MNFNIPQFLDLIRSTIKFEGGVEMKKIINKFGTVVVSFALVLSVIAANQACAFFAYQPELPDSVKSLRKF